MSRASPNPQSPDQRIRELFAQFAKELTSSTFTTTDPKTGYKVRVRRQLTTAEQQRFYNSLPEGLRAHMDSKRQERFANTSDQDDYIDNLNDSEDPDELVIASDDDEPIEEPAERQMGADLVVYETFLGFDQAYIPQRIEQSLAPDILKALNASPAFKSRERPFNITRKKKGKNSKNRFVTSPILQEIAKRRLWRILRQKHQERLYKQKQWVTYVDIRIVYIERNP